MNCGPVRCKVDDRRQTRKRPFVHKVIVRPTGFRLPPHMEAKESPSIHELYAALTSDKKRTQMIVEDVVDAVRAGRFPVLLTERHEHFEKITALLSPRIRNLFIMKGGRGKRQRNTILDQMQALGDNDKRIILATGRYLGEGFDDARLDTLFLALPVSWKGVLAQYGVGSIVSMT
jgi:superfamily II DNA or RNA helicase